jgi:MFS family permease
MFVWFAVTFWAYLETKSVIVAAVMAGVYSLTVALSGFFLGSLVDRYRNGDAALKHRLIFLYMPASFLSRRRIMLFSSVALWSCYPCALPAPSPICGIAFNTRDNPDTRRKPR